MKSTSTIELLEFEEAREQVKLSERSLYRKAASREIASVKLGGRLYFKPEDIAAFIERNRREAVAR